MNFIKYFSVALLIFCLGYSNAFSQTPCGTIMGDEQMDWLRDFQNNKRTTYNRMADGEVWLPVQFHILGTDEGTGYYEEYNLVQLVCETNQQFEATGLNFRIFINNMEFLYHNNTFLWEHSGSPSNQHATLYNQYRIADVINVFILSETFTSCGYWWPGGGDIISLNVNCIGPNSATFPHELGHYFSLPHTFDGWPQDASETYFTNPIPEFEWENVARTGPNQNCYSRGDLFCDTAPDYANYPWSACPFPDGPFQDKFGVSFNPDSSFFMNYGRASCKDRFSEEQMAAMDASLYLEREYLLDFDSDIDLSEIGIVEAIFPVDDQENLASESLLLQWDAGAASRFYLTVIKSGGISIVDTLIYTNSFLLEDLEMNKNYIWRVKPFSDLDMCQGQSLNSFRTGEIELLNLEVIEISPPTCFGYADASINVQAIGGQGPYEYLWNDGSTGSNLTNTEGGLKTVTITDALGLTNTLDINLISPEGVSLLVKQEGDSLVAYTSGGSGNFEYSWSNGSSASTISDIESGESIELEITDENGCSTSAAFNVLDIEVEFNQLLCPDDLSASIILGEITGGSGDYSILWNNGFTGTEALNVPPGTYSVKITDNGADNFEYVIEFNVSPPAAMDANVAVENGIATIEVIGGQEPYDVSWSSGENGETASALDLGINTVYITDANDCEISKEFEVFELPVIIQTTDVKCKGDADGTAEIITPSWGSGSFSYEWSDGGNGQIRNDLEADDYTVLITDEESGFSQEVELEIDEPNQPIQTVFEQNGTEVSIQVTGGNNPYDYTWPDGSEEAQTSDLNAGPNTLQIVDENNCNVEIQFNYLTLAATVSNVDCKDADSGQISIDEIDGGAGDIDVSWSTGSSQMTVDGLSPGSYSVSINDEEGFGTSFDFAVEEAETELTVEIITEGNDLTTQVNGGWGAYTYVWSNGSQEANLSNLADGIYTLTVVDAQGCSIERTAEVSTTGINGLNNSLVKFYPNPISRNQFLNFETSELTKDTILKIYDRQGRLIKTQQLNNLASDKIKVDFAAGLYFVKFISSENEFSKKLIVY